MSSKRRKQSLQIRCYYDESSEGTNQHSKSKVPNKPESDPLELEPSSSSSLQEPQKNIVNKEPEACKKTTTWKTKISRITCCDQDFKKKFGFRKHIRTKHPSTKEELRLCLNCNTMVKATANAIIIHMKKIHNTNSPGNFVRADDEFLNKNCTHSFLRAMSKMAMSSKMPVASSMVFSCKECKVLFFDKKVYQEHTKSHEEHPNVKILYFKECKCGLTFYEDSQYQSHWHLMHSGNFSPCSHCQRHETV